MSHVKIKEGNISPAKSWKGFDLIELILRQRKSIQAIILMLLAKFVNDQELANSLAAFLFCLLIEALRYYYNKVE